MATTFTPTARAIGGHNGAPSDKRPHVQRMELGLHNARWYAELALRNGATQEQVLAAAQLAIENVCADRIHPGGNT